MLRMRKEQMQVFEGAALRNFEQYMVQHLKEFAPKYCEAIGDSGLRSVIQLGVQRAATYRLTDRGPVRFFIELMFMLGIDFDTDPQFPWVMEALTDQVMPNQNRRADKLYDCVMNYIDAVGGPKYEYVRDALRRVIHLKFEDLPASDKDFEYQILSRLEMLYPQKYEYVGCQVVRSLITPGAELAKKHAFTTYPGISLFIAHMFAFGHGFTHDPRLPWVALILQNKDLQYQNDRARSLYAGMISFFKEKLADFDRGK